MAQATGALNPAYLVVGTDDLKRDTTIARLKGHLDPSLEVFNLDERDGAATKADDVPSLVASLQTLPLGDGVRIVVVRNADRLPKRGTEAVLAYLRDPTPGCVLLLVADRLAPTTELYKAAKAAGPRAVIDCAPQTGYRLIPLVTRMAAKSGLAMDEDAAKELVSRVGESTTMLSTQIALLKTFCGEGGHVSRADVEAHVARVAEAKPWDFLDAVSMRDATRALQQYELLKAGSTQTGLLSLLTQRVRELVCAQSLDARGESGRLVSELGIGANRAFAVKHHVSWSRRFAQGELGRALVACARADEAMKSGADADVEMVRLVVAICSGEGL